MRPYVQVERRVKSNWAFPSEVDLNAIMFLSYLKASSVQRNPTPCRVIEGAQSYWRGGPIHVKSIRAIDHSPFPFTQQILSSPGLPATLKGHTPYRDPSGSATSIGIVFGTGPSESRVWLDLLKSASKPSRPCDSCPLELTNVMPCSLS